MINKPIRQRLLYDMPVLYYCTNKERCMLIDKNQHGKLKKTFSVPSRHLKGGDRSDYNVLDKI